MTLLESDQRKAAFLREACDVAPNARVVAVRSEVFDQAVDTVVARGVRWPDVLGLARRIPAIQGGVVVCGEAEALALAGTPGVGADLNEPVPWAEGRVLVRFHVEH